MTSKQIHARRRELEEQLATTLKNYYKVGADIATAKRATENAQSELSRTRVELAQGRVTGDALEAAIEKARTTAERLEEVKAQSDATYQARGELERQIDTLLSNHFETFAEAASKQSERAEEAVAIVEKAMLRAESLWREAQEAWRPLCRATSISPVPPFPLSRADVVPARPPSVREIEAA